MLFLKGSIEDNNVCEFGLYDPPYTATHGEY